MSARKSLRQAMIAIDEAFAEHAEICPACAKDSPAICKIGLALLKRLHAIIHTQITRDRAQPIRECELCGGSGWRRISVDKNQVVRCSCCKPATVTSIRDAKMAAAGDR